MWPEIFLGFKIFMDQIILNFSQLFKKKTFFCSFSFLRKNNGLIYACGAGILRLYARNDDNDEQHQTGGNNILTVQFRSQLISAMDCSSSTNI